MGGTPIARSLRLSLLAATLSIAVVAVLAAAWVSNRETKREISTAVRTDTERLDLVANEFHVRAFDFARFDFDPWSEAGAPAIGARGLSEFVANVASRYHLRVIVRTTAGELLADSEGRDGEGQAANSATTVRAPGDSPEAQRDRLATYYDRLGKCYAKHHLATGREVVDALGLTRPGEVNIEQQNIPAREAQAYVVECTSLAGDVLEFQPKFPPVDLFVARPNYAATVADVDGVTTRLLLTIIAVIGVAVLITALVARRILRPIGKLTAAAQVMSRGDLGHRVGLRRTDEIGQLADTFDAMATSLERSAQQRKRMTSDIAHELRTPLSNIRGYLEAAQDGVAPLTPQLVASLLEDTMLLQGLVEDLQELSVAESGQLSLNTTPVDLDDLAISVAEAQRARAFQRGIAIVTDCASGVTAELDVRRMRQVLTNLVENAIRHTDPGGTIEVSTARLSSGVAVAVADTGTGIEAEHLPNIFDRFYRTDASRNRATGGSGLGLAITRELVTAHGGAISVESEVGSGSTFTVVLPLDAVSTVGTNGSTAALSVYSSRG